MSDDTQMTLFSLEAILRGEVESETSLLASAQVAYRDWFRTQNESVPSPTRRPRQLSDFPELHVRRAPGTTCLNALSDAWKQIRRVARNDSKGCGTVMRSAPFGMLPHLLADTEAYRLSAACSELTHEHPTATAAAGATAYLVYHLMRRQPIEQALGKVLKHLAGVQGAGEVVDALQRALAHAGSDRGETAVARHAAIIGNIGVDPALDGKSRGWVAEEALAIAVYACLVARDFDSAIQIAANHDGDSDSTAAVCGNLWGAMCGVESLNLATILAVDVLAPIEWLLATLFQRYGVDYFTHTSE